MLRELHVRDLALIDEAWLEFEPGLNVISGETGAGKTALVVALKLLLGGRSDSRMVRAGATEALVEGVFEHEAREILVKRRVGVDGRSRCVVDGEMSSVSALAGGLAPLVDLHGQHDHQSLLRPANHVSYLDGYIGTTARAARETYSAARTEFFAATEALAKLQATIGDLQREAEELTSLIADIDSVAPAMGEDEEIAARVAILQHSGRLTEATAEAFGSLRDEDGATEGASRALVALTRVASLDPAVEAFRGRLEVLLGGLDDIAGELREYGESLEHDTDQLEFGHDRLATLTLLKKKYGVTIEEVLQCRADAVARLALLEDADHSIAGASSRVEAAVADYQVVAETLASIRSAAIPGFVSRLHDAVADLSMDGARFEVSMEPLELDAWSNDGPHRVEFTYAPGPEQPYRPFAKIASGGELSRVMLALKSVLSGADPVPVLVFDEVDAGIGGATATAIGRRLSLLAEKHQVLVVTHLAQVAAFADRHLVVTKSVDSDGVRTQVDHVADEARIAEVARMLSGGSSETGLAHASELLASAKRSRTEGRKDALVGNR
ncbi:MAG: DNA repair protein RecN [Actinobacteria bacterium]|nr:DNA repair protein RecN [Actinomycetota bacterium]